MKGTSTRAPAAVALRGLPIALAALVSLTLLNAATASGQERLAAGCEPPPDGFLGVSGEETGSGAIAQPFTPRVSGALTRAEIAIGKEPSPPGDYAVQVRTTDATGAPTSVVLASATIPDASVPLWDGAPPAEIPLVTVAFATPAAVSTEATYALLIARPASETVRIGTRGGGQCPNTLWYSFDGVEWEEHFEEADMVFRAFVTPRTCRGVPATTFGTGGSDRIVGTADRDVIAALGGNDRVLGLGGKDLICGGAGRDKLSGGKGKDKLYGESGKDKLRGGGAKDRCLGGKGDDSAKGCEVEKSI